MFTLQLHAPRICVSYIQLQYKHWYHEHLLKFLPASSVTDTGTCWKNPVNCFCTCWIVLHAYSSLDVILLLVPGSVAVMTKAYPSIERNDLILLQEIASYMLLTCGAVYVISVREFWMFICADRLCNWLNNSEILAIKSCRTFMHLYSVIFCLGIYHCN